MKKLLLPIIIITLLTGAFFGGRWFLSTTKYQSWQLEREKSELPASISLDSINEQTDSGSADDSDVSESQKSKESSAGVDAELEKQFTKEAMPSGEIVVEIASDKSATETAALIPAEFNLDIPFTSQAPQGNWDAAHEEYCEEASLLMVNRFLTNRAIDSPDDADEAMRGIADYQVETFGYFESTTAIKTAQIAQDYLGLHTKVVQDFTWDDVKSEMTQGHVVILPAAGRQLSNPFFTPPGPNYHMLVVKGWTADKIITNDPGTKRGADYIYDPNILFDAVGDYNHGDPANGTKSMVVVWN